MGWEQSAPLSSLSSAEEEVFEFYELLGVSRSATQAEIKKAYHKAALSSHPDKVPEDFREEAEIRFKRVSQAYEILSDEDKRRDYDEFGIDGVNGGRRGPGAGPGMNGETEEEFFAQFFSSMNGNYGAQRRAGRTEDAIIELQCSLEELYRGKTEKMASTRNVLCPSCKGTGGRPSAQKKKCGNCNGQGHLKGVHAVGNGIYTSSIKKCEVCNGMGSFLRDRDRCRKCKGQKVVEQSKILEIYIPRGSKDGDKILLSEEADQEPNKKTGDIIIVVKQKPHPTFERKGNDLKAILDVSIPEALCGYCRLAFVHLDGRGLHISTRKGQVLRPGQCLRVAGEGMFKKGTDDKGDLFLVINVVFPPDNWTREQSDMKNLESILPPLLNRTTPAPSRETDELDLKPGSLDDYGTTLHEDESDDERQEDGEDEWYGDQEPGCATQ